MGTLQDSGALTTFGLLAVKIGHVSSDYIIYIFA